MSEVKMCAEQSSHEQLLEELFSKVPLSKIQHELYRRACPEFPPEPIPKLSNLAVNEQTNTDMGMHKGTTQVQKTLPSSMKEMVEVFRHIALEHTPEGATMATIKQVASLISADRVSIYVVDKNGELELKATTGKAVRHISAKGSITASVATTGVTIRVNDVNACPQHDRTQDLASGYTTRSLLVAPCFGDSTNPVAVLQVVNKLPEGTMFSELDEMLVSSVAGISGMTLRNCDIYMRAQASEIRAEGILEICYALRTNINPSSFMFTINHRVQELLKAERSTLFLCDWRRRQLLTGSSSRTCQLKIPMSSGILGHCATKCITINVTENLREHPLFEEAADTPNLCIEPNAILCAPIIRSVWIACDKDNKSIYRNDVIGVMQLINRKDENGFTEDDVALLERIVDMVGKFCSGGSEDAPHALNVEHFLKKTGFDDLRGEGEASILKSVVSSNKSSSHKQILHMDTFSEE